MPSSNETNHGLKLWVENDVPTMDDFNDDSQILEAFMSTNGISNCRFQLPADAWENTPYVSYPYQAVISVPGMKEHDDAMVLFDMHSVFDTKNAGITNGVGQTVDGGVRIYALKKPVSALSGVCTMMHREG